MGVHQPLFVPGDGHIIHYIDVKDGSEIQSFDTGFGSYNPRISGRVIAKADDLYMLLGRHLQSDNHYIYKVYSKSLTSIPQSSVDADSPNPTVLNPIYLHDKIIFTSTGVSVEDSSPPMIYFDTDFDILGRTDLTSIFSKAHIQGGSFIGRLSNGNYVLIACVTDNHLAKATTYTIRYIEISGTDFSIVSDTPLYTSTDPNNHISYILQGLSYSDKFNLPLIDPISKKAYFIGYGKKDGSEKSALIEVDLSDLDIVEWNMYNFNPRIKI